MHSSESNYRAAPDVTLTELADGTGVLLHLGTKFYYSLNEAGITAWKALAAGASREGVASVIADRFEIDVERAADDIAPVLSELLAEGLIARDR